MNAERGTTHGTSWNDLEPTQQVKTLLAQVEDLKYTLHNVLQCMIANSDVSHQERYEALINDARAALAAKENHYLD